MDNDLSSGSHFLFPLFNGQMSLSGTNQNWQFGDAELSEMSGIVLDFTFGLDNLPSVETVVNFIDPTSGKLDLPELRRFCEDMERYGFVNKINALNDELQKLCKFCCFNLDGTLDGRTFVQNQVYFKAGTPYPEQYDLLNRYVLWMREIAQYKRNFGRLPFNPKMAKSIFEPLRLVRESLEVRVNYDRDFRNYFEEAGIKTLKVWNLVSINVETGKVDYSKNTELPFEFIEAAKQTYFLQLINQAAEKVNAETDRGVCFGETLDLIPFLAQN